MARLIREWSRLDWPLLGAVVLLIVFGLVALYSISLSHGEALWARQGVYAIVGLASLLFVSRTDVHRLRGKSFLLYVFGVVLLVLVLVAGKTIRGTTGWFVVGPVGFQPVEFMKLALLFFLASFLSARREGDRELSTIFTAALIVLVPAALVMAQPDIGSAFVLVMIGFGMIGIGIRRPWVRVLFVVLCIAAVAGGWFFVLSDWQKERILTYVQPDRDPLGRGYNVRQSIIAVGSGGVGGKGLGLGSQGQLYFLPEASTDFIFAVIAEELGFFGASGVLLLFGFLFARIGFIARLSRDYFHMLLASGVGIMIIVPVVINIGMNMGMMPVTGLPLLFVSRGGSALVSSLIGVGILQSIFRRERF